MLNLTINIGVMLKGSGAVVHTSTGGYVSSNIAIAVMTVMFVIYGMAGELSAAIVADFIQGVLTAAESLRFVMVKSTGPEFYLPWQMVFYLGAGLLAGIIVSLLTKPVAKEKLDNFYALVRTPVKLGEKIPAPCTLPADAIVPEKRNIFPNTNLEIAIPSLTSVIGFLAGWGCVSVIIYSVYLIANM